MKCPKHPRYKGIRKPTTRGEDCVCAEVYRERLANKLSPEQQAVHDVETLKTKRVLADLRKAGKAKDSRLVDMERRLEAVLTLTGADQEYTIRPNGSKENEATAVICWSDWHIECMITKAQTNGSNQFNARVAQERIQRLVRHTVKLVKKEQVAVGLKKAVLWLGGDFIDGNLHPDSVESNRLQPIDAIVESEMHIKACINYLLAETDLEEIVVVCSPGNHSRITQKQRVATEPGNSLEIFMYHHLRAYFANEPRLHFVVSASYHTYIKVYKWVLRFHHGTNIRFNGGLGGPTISVNKAINGWNTTQRADLDVFGHLHSFMDGGRFLMNGSLLGHSPYAISIKANYQPPRQAFFLVDRDDGKTVVCPIILERDK